MASSTTMPRTTISPASAIALNVMLNIGKTVNAAIKQKGIPKAVQKAAFLLKKRKRSINTIIKPERALLKRSRSRIRVVFDWSFTNVY